MSCELHCEPLPGLEVGALVAALPAPLGELVAPAVDERSVAAAAAPVEPTLRAAVRDVLRQRGYRPTGRGKPSSEYLAGAAAAGRWPRINAVVDAANLVSLRSGLPISIVDCERLSPPWSVRCGRPGEQFVFNLGGQTIDVDGLPCLCDASGPCANAVKDAQRTKTSAATRAVLAVVWGVAGPRADFSRAVLGDLAARLQALGATTTAVATLR